MKRTPILLFAALAALTLSLSDLADARRMGGGRTLGAQRESVTPSRPAPAPTAPAGNTATQPSTPAAGAAKAAPG
ncbi:MAG TPA: Tim44 domain-containing protein, partial [Casimicrobiaceae bacterium]|nr:Tim44 domain-containing protein [Casimicrobiaceae bacterium]